MDYLVQTRTPSSTLWHGLHELCWQRSVAGVPSLDAQLDVAHMLIGEADDEALKLTNERDRLGELCAAYEAKFKLQRDVVDAAVAVMQCGDADTSEEYNQRYTRLSDNVRAMLLAAKERGDGTV